MVDKSSQDIGIFETSEEFVEAGQENVQQAINVYDRYFSKDSIESVQDYIIKDVL